MERNDRIGEPGPPSPAAPARSLITSLAMVPHPEGGYFREVGRGSERVLVPGRGVERSAWTLIWFLLASGDASRWHRLVSDEIWIHLEGAPLELFTIDDAEASPVRTILGPVSRGHVPVVKVERENWQAARSLGEHTLVSCLVAPGFEYEDFRLLRDDDAERRRLEPRLGPLAPLV